MPRINIEESLYQDTRFVALFYELQDFEKALGAMVRAWSLAQRWYLKGNGMIPKTEWQKHKINDKIIEVGLATEANSFVRMAGSDEQFQWLRQKSSARKGKKFQLAENIQKTEKQRATSPDNVRLSYDNGPEALSLSLSLSPSLSHKELNTLGTSPNKLADGPAPKLSEEVVFKNETELLKALPQTTKDRWSRLYSDLEFITREVTKAYGYYHDNPRKLPKTLRGWSMALSSWLERGWPRHVKNIETNKKVDIRAILERNK